MEKLSDNYVPGADFPALDEAIEHVGVAFGEGSGKVGRVTAKDQQRGVGRVGEGASEQKSAALRSALGVSEMELAERSAAFYEVLHNMIEEGIVAHGCLP